MILLRAHFDQDIAAHHRTVVAHIAEPILLAPTQPRQPD